MDVGSAAKEFRIRLYRWALAEWKEEIETDFRLLGKVGSNTAAKTVEILRALPENDRHGLAHAMAKRFHKDAANHVGDKLTPADASRLRWLDTARLMATSHRSPISPHRSLRKRLTLQLRSDLAFLGAVESLGGLQWRHVTARGAWRFVTHVDSGGRFGDCSYSHTIETLGAVAIAQYLSLLAWLGVSSETKWRIASEGDTIAASANMAELCRHFLAAVPLLLDGLVVDS